MRVPPLSPALILPLLAQPLLAQATWIAKPLPRPCKPQTAIEFIAPMESEEVPVFHSAEPDSWHVILEISTEQIPGVEITPVFESNLFPSPGAAAAIPTDVNGDLIPGDAHPAIPGLSLTMDDDLVFAGFLIPGGTNLASLIEMIASEIEHGGDQSTTCTWIVSPAYTIIDTNGDGMTLLTTSINGATDVERVRHGADPVYQGLLSVQTPTISIWTEDWISTVDSDSLTSETPFLVGVEVRIPCYFDGSTIPPTPVPLDPIFGPCQGGTMACTGTFPAPAVPTAFHPAFPSLDVRFSDTYTDKAGNTLPGGVVTGGQCGVIWGSTGTNLAYLFEQASVHAWYGVNGFPDTTPLGGGDDQLIYRFTMVADGMILDTDVLTEEMLITAAIESSSNCFSITNVRVKHRPDVVTPNPGP